VAIGQKTSGAKVVPSSQWAKGSAVSLLAVQHRSQSCSSRTLKLYDCALPHLLDSLRFIFKITETSRDMRFKEISELAANMPVLYRYIRQNCYIYLVLPCWIVTTALIPYSFLFHEGTPEIIINVPRHLQLCKRIEARTNLILGSAIQIQNYCKFPVLPISGQNFPRYLEGCLEFFAAFQRFYPFIYSATSRETPDNVPRNSGWETQIYADAPRPVCKYHAAKGDSHVDKLLFKATKPCTRLLVEHHMSG